MGCRSTTLPKKVKQSTVFLIISPGDTNISIPAYDDMPCISARYLGFTILKVPVVTDTRNLRMSLASQKLWMQRWSSETCFHVNPSPLASGEIFILQVIFEAQLRALFTGKYLWVNSFLELVGLVRLPFLVSGSNTREPYPRREDGRVGMSAKDEGYTRS